MPLPLPDNPLPYLVEWLFEIGPVLPAGMASGPIEWRDLAAWSSVTGIDLLPWEAALLRRLSKSYLAQQHDAQKPDCPAPWTARDDAGAAREAVARKVSSIFRAMTIAQSSSKGRKA